MAFVISKGKTPNGKYIAFIDPSKPENKDTFTHKDKFKYNGAKFDNFKKMWFWYIGETPEQWKNVFEKLIKPALLQAHSSQGSSEEESKNAIIQSLEKLVGEIEKAPVSPSAGITQEEKNQIKEKLKAFKQKLVNIESMEEFKDTMRKIVRFKNAQGHKLSFGNAILVMIQDPKATYVMGKNRWNDPYGRAVKENSPHVLIYAPSVRSFRQKGDLKKEKEEYAKENGYKSFNDMPVGLQDKFNVRSRGSFAGGFKVVPAYDIRFTVPIEGKEDKAADLEATQAIKWYEDQQVSEEVRPVYDGLLEFAKKAGISVEMADEKELRGARGVSMSGKIKVLNNEGNDVGITKTLAHEIAHELLHQKYLKEKNTDYGKYFVGTEQGREVVEQQAEIVAWAVMTAYGFDLDISSMNYTIMWGAEGSESMVKVFNGVSGVVNRMIDEINKHKEVEQSNESELHEDGGSHSQASHITPDELAAKLGMGDMYQKAKREVSMKEQFMETYYRKVNHIIKG